MNTKYYLAVDIGASSGRHMLSHLENGKIVLEEIYRFPNGMIEKNGHKVWDVDQLFQEILIGMKKCAMVGKIPYSMGIDTWAVDFVLLDENDTHDHCRLPTSPLSRNSLYMASIFSFFKAHPVNVFIRKIIAAMHRYLFFIGLLSLPFFHRIAQHYIKVAS